MRIFTKLPSAAELYAQQKEKRDGSYWAGIPGLFYWGGRGYYKKAILKAAEKGYSTVQYLSWSLSTKDMATLSKLGYQFNQEDTRCPAWEDDDTEITISWKQDNVKSARRRREEPAASARVPLGAFLRMRRGNGKQAKPLEEILLLKF